ncbi:MAG: DegT/DnrJ/EryC1/StrS family aminotransferase, partial [Pseudomonadota bacterium]
MNNNIPMLDLSRQYKQMKNEIDRALKNCLQHQQWILGPEVRKFEEAAAQYLNVKFCVGTSSGTESLLIALRALALNRFHQEYFKQEQKIITTPLTFTATGDAILRSGATPVF